ncbi:PAS domain-containing sensor histidine kinase [Halalkalibacillus sediminis]|uniref:histidine kinase n=1 Tax=Halalkalibacillus sediminis TaxID=2018042 RepID=A0A2I0QX12_9BACI|nr:ATP-binding protein [Halalkalibacillus sediminis]PKR78883.1 PAS domain-containing sensor histidine kinase [Halalkalibacillus sediminis]
MFWKSVVFKLWFTIILLVAFILMIVTVLLLEFFENFYVNEAEENLLNQAGNVATVLHEHDDETLQMETIDQLMDPSTQLTIFFNEHRYWQNEATSEENGAIDPSWFISNEKINQVLNEREEVKKITTFEGSDTELVVVGTPTLDGEGAVYVYQSLDVVQETTTHATKLILITATIAIILTTVFAFFLSNRITAPLIKMRKAASELSRGEFHTKVPVLTYDEIGELANSFNRMRRQLNFHITALNQEKSQLSSILKSMADGVVTVNRKNEIMLINPPAEQFLERFAFENEQDSLDLPKEIQEDFDKVLRNEQEILKEVTTQGRVFVLVMTPLYNESVIRGVVTIIRDMTEERQLDKLRKDFLANVSHELRTPISMMQGYSEAIVDDVAETKEEKQELAQIIYEESLRMGRLVNDLLDLARMEAGHIHLNREKVPLKPFIDRISKKFTSIASEQQVDLKTDFQAPHEFIHFDPDRLEQVMTNLIDNALRHTPSDGTVSVIVEGDKDDLVVHVHDNGSGISEEDLPFIFERFYKSDKARTRNSEKKGTGLGLSITKHIIEAHGGNIYAKSKVDEGTTFTFSLPLYNDQIQEG